MFGRPSAASRPALVVVRFAAELTHRDGDVAEAASASRRIADRNCVAAWPVCGRGAEHYRDVAKTGLAMEAGPAPMSMPLMPMHVPLAVPIAPSDAVANATAAPDATAVRSRPLGILSFELTLRISISCASLFTRFGR